MADIKLNGGEFDSNDMWENAVRANLDKGSTVVFPHSKLSDYDLLDPDETVIDGTPKQKCEQIADKVGCEFKIVDDQVVFSRRNSDG